MELTIALLVMGVIMAVGSLSTSATATRFKQRAETGRLVSCLRWLREMAREHGKFASTGYGVFFWYNPRSGSCFEYSPFTAQWPTRFVPDHPRNALTPFYEMGLPNEPVSLGLRTYQEKQIQTGDELSSGFSIYFQTDTMGQPNRYPDSMRDQPNQPQGGTSWREYRVVFWPPGVNAATPPYPNERGVTLPRFSGVYYNRIYLASATDDPYANPPRLPARIRIDPGTGLIRVLGADERRADGSW